MQEISYICSMRYKKNILYYSLAIVVTAAALYAFTSVGEPKDPLPSEWNMTTLAQAYMYFSDSRDVMTDFSGKKSADIPPRKLVAKGSNMKVLGFVEDDFALWVEHPDGDRGWMKMSDFSHEFILADKERFQTAKKDSTIKFKAGATFTYKGVDSKEKDILLIENDLGVFRLSRRKDLVIKEVMNDGHWKYCVNGSRRSVRTKAGFEELVMGKDLATVEASLNTPAQMVRNIGKNNCKATFNVWVYCINMVKDKKKAQYMRPVLTLENGAVTGVEYEFRHGARPWLRYVPLWRFVADKLSCLTEDTIYNSFNCFYYPALTRGRNLDFVIWLLIPFVLLGWLVYNLATPLLPFFVLMILLQRPWPFKPLGNTFVNISFTVIALACCYIWLIALMIMNWGLIIALPIMLPLIGLVGSFEMVARTVEYRCPQCKYIDTYVFSHREWLEEYQDRRDEVRPEYLGSEVVRSWKTWTHHWGQDEYGNKYSYDTDKKTHEEVETTWRNHRYGVLYRIRPYRDWEKCQRCGKMRYTYGEVREELNREYKGSTISTDSSVNTY